MIPAAAYSTTATGDVPTVLAEASSMPASGPEDLSRLRRMVDFAIKHHERVVLQFNYVDSKGQVSTRCISAVRLIKRDCLRAWCLMRGEYRTFELARMAQVQFGLAALQQSQAL